jgi:hypothetical protein
MAHADILDTAKRRIFVQTVWSEKEMIKLVPGSSWDNDRKLWTVPLTWPACLQLRGIFGQTLTVGPELTRWAAEEHAGRVGRALELRNLTELNHD